MSLPIRANSSSNKTIFPSSAPLDSNQPQCPPSFSLPFPSTSQPGKECTPSSRAVQPAARSQHGNRRSGREGHTSSTSPCLISSLDRGHATDVSAFPTSAGISHDGSRDCSNLSSAWIPSVPQDHFSRTPVTASTATTATTSATATATTATTATTASGFVSEPSSTYLNPASAFSTSTVDDLYLNSFPALSHTLSSDKAVSAVDTLSSTSSHQPSPDTFTNYKKDFHLDPGQFHSGVDYFGDLIQSDSHAGSASANAGHQVYHDPFAFDPMSWEFDINHALEAAFLTQAPPYPSLVATVAGESGDGSASSNGVVGGGHAGTVNSHVNVNPINRSGMHPCHFANILSHARYADCNIPSANIDGNTSSSAKTLSVSSTSSTSTTKPRTTKRFSPNSAPVSTDTQSSKRRKRTVATASSTSPTVSHSSNATDSPTATASASASAPADASVSPPSTAADSAAEKRRRNTLAARRCRQRQLDRVAALESALEEALKERDDARVEIARLKGENEVLRSLIGPGNR